MDWNYTKNPDYCENTVLESQSIIAVLAAIAVLLILLSVLGNGLVIFAVYKTESLQTPTVFFLASLAMADFLTGLLVIPTWSIRLILDFRKPSNPFSIVTELLTLLTMAASTYSLCAVTLDRYFAIIHTLKYNLMVTRNRTFKVIIVVWVMSFLTGIFRTFFSDQKRLRLVYICSIAIIAIIPFTIITISYVRIFLVARIQARRIAAEHRSVSPESKRNTKAAKTVAIVILIFTLSWLPLLVFCALEFRHVSFYSVCDNLRSRFRFAAVAVVLAFTSSVWNPLIYTLRYKKFRQAFKRIICKITV